MPDPLFRCDGVRVGGRLRLPALAIGDGVTAILGPSGAGKSTLLALLGGLLQADAGTVARPADGGGRLGFLWSPDGAWWPGLDARAHLRAVAGDDRRAEELLAAFGLLAAADRHPAALSAGERDRLACARALASGARAILLDEPFAHLDAVQADACWEELLTRAQAGGQALVYATHAPERVVGWADRVVCLRDGGLLAEGAVDDLYRRPADPATAAALGPCTWLDAGAAAALLGDAGRAGPWRPEALSLAADPAGPAVLAAHRFHGAMAASDLDHAGGRTRIWHRPAAALATGARVRLALAALALALLAGCGAAPDPAPTGLAVAVPPDGGRQPAPRGVAALADGWLVLDTAGRLLDYGPDRRLRRQWAMPEHEAGRPENACQLPDGGIAVADTHYHRVVVFERDGRERLRFGAEGDAPGRFRWPVGICCAPDGRLFVSEYGGNDRIQAFTSTGAWLAAFGRLGTAPGELSRPQGLCWSGGRLLVADAMNQRVQAFAGDGRFLGVLGGGQPPELRLPYALAANPQGGVDVVEYQGNRVTRLDADGRLLARFGRPGRGEGELSTPWGLAGDGRGRLWVADTGNRRIMEYGP